jgi:superfamily II DNA or RNA helicase
VAEGHAAPSTLVPAHSGMQISQSDRVRVRRTNWHVADVRSYGACTLVTLEGAELVNSGLQLRVLSPFERVERIVRPARPRRISTRAWRRACRALIANQSSPQCLRSLTAADVDLLPYQLEPALAVVAGLSARLLVADDVGLGKTIQAGAIAAELRARGAADRVLVLTPAGLRDQWQRELRRFALSAAIADVSTLRRTCRRLPPGVNPWLTLDVAIASIDYVKQLDVLSDVASCRWDLLIVDEAHNAVGDSERHAAVAALAARTTYLVLLTATPHSGNRSAFESLCALGADGTRPLLAFRRTRPEAGTTTRRRVHRLLVRPAAAERRMHGVLAQFSRAVDRDRGSAAALALATLHKRALSSARSLRLSVERRLAALDSGPEGDAGQLPLPLEPGWSAAGELNPEDAAPEWPDALQLNDRGRERQWLSDLAAAAAACTSESKVAALGRLLRRTAEPMIVFTEYRDTLLHVRAQIGQDALVLHGGMRREERDATLEHFAAGPTRVLLATDAAAEGLNLHERCRMVVNLELPWNPMRLEQRIGRVDRIGQRRTVHAFHLIARGAEQSRMLVRLRERIAEAQRAVAAPDPLGRDGATPSGSSSPLLEPPPAYLRDAAAREARRITALRRFSRPLEPTRPGLVDVGPCLARTRRWRTRALLADRALTLWRVVAEDGSGRFVGSVVVALAVPDGALAGNPPELAERASDAAAAWFRDAVGTHEQFTASRLHRARALLEQPPGPSRLFQPGLFDRRTEQARLATAASVQAARQQAAARLTALERARRVVLRPQLALVLTTR